MEYHSRVVFNFVLFVTKIFCLRPETKPVNQF